MEKLMYTIPEAARALALSKGKVYAMASSGEIECVRFGRSVRITATGLSKAAGVNNAG